MSLFSDFIRNATPEEKRAVYAEVMDRAINRQQVAARGYVRTTGPEGIRARGSLPIPEGAMRVGPGTDAVVWRICPDYKSEL